MSKVSNFWRYITGWRTTRYFWDDLRNSVEKRDDDEVASMEIGLPPSDDRMTLLTQLAEESALAEGNAIYVTDQDNHWEGKRYPFPSKDEDWLYIGQMYPGYFITDVHITDISVHVYIRKRSTT